MIVFFTIMVLVGFSWRTAARSVISTEQEQVQVRAQFAEVNIKQRLALYNAALMSAAGFFSHSTEVTRDEWKGYIDSLQIGETLPAIMGFGFTPIVTSSNKAAFESEIKAFGYPEYEITPVDPARDVYMPIKYIEPFNERNKNTFGRDMYFEENRRKAMDLARDTHEVTMTDVGILRQDDNSFRNGVTMFYPVYKKGMPTLTVEERRAALSGFVYAPIRSDTIFGDIFDEHATEFNFQVYDGEESNDSTLLYVRESDSQSDPYRWIASGTISANNQEWNVNYGVQDGIVDSGLRERPRNSAIGGTVFAVTISLVVYLLLQRRNRLIKEKQEFNLQLAKDNLLSLASHQLRTPATGVKQYIGMVLEGFTGKISSEQELMLKRAYESNERQLRIINEFLYLAKADAERIVISPQKFDIIELIKEVLSDMDNELMEAGHELIFSHRAKSIPVFADIHSARMIIENLISNAIKYTPEGGKIRILIKKSGHKINLLVSDNGVGIKKSDYPKLFQQFSRIPNKLTKSTSGSGIGLYLAQHLAKLNGGEISVVSEKDRGSTFTASFPQRNVKKITVLKRKKNVS